MLSPHGFRSRREKTIDINLNFMYRQLFYIISCGEGLAIGKSDKGTRMDTTVTVMLNHSVYFMDLLVLLNTILDRYGVILGWGSSAND